MARCLSPRPITLGGSLTQEIKACPHVVWDTVMDKDNATRILRNLVERQVIQEGKRGVGSIVREVRMTKGKHQQESFKTITSLSTPNDNDEKYSITVNVHLTEKSAFSGTKDAARTGSYTLVPGNSPNTCIFIWTFSAVPEGPFGVLWILLCKRRMLRDLEHHFGQDLQDYATEAEKRQAIQDCSSGKQHYRDSHRDH
jgi:hypothetical protein|mmetsp:Transcript_22720/g.41306  ORF Transcript_22720/g.41306 Transcript_22720/m.41306 type:complete len:198 (+) Transcript_22720:92-685(+)